MKGFLRIAAKLKKSTCRESDFIDERVGQLSFRSVVPGHPFKFCLLILKPCLAGLVPASDILPIE
jgi:hypothetical protein